MSRAACLCVLPAALAAAAGASFVLPPGALAATGKSAAATAPGFSIDAVGSRPYFRYTLARGRRARGTVRLVSTSRRTVHVLLQATDVGTAATGGLDYGASPSQATDRLLRLSRQGVRLDPGATVDVAFTATAPPSAGPGDRFAGIVALNRDQVRAARRGSRRKGFSLRFLPRLAIAVQVTLPGPATRELKVGNAGIDVTPSSTDITLLLRNTGNKLIKRTGGRLAISQDGRVLVRRRVEISAFVPATTLSYRVPLVGRPAEGTYRVRGILRPQRGAPVTVDETVSFGKTAAGEFKRETGREATRSGPSVLLLAGLAAALAVVLALVVALVRARRQLATGGRPPHDPA